MVINCISMAINALNGHWLLGIPEAPNMPNGKVPGKVPWKASTGRFPEKVPKLPRSGKVSRKASTWSNNPWYSMTIFKTHERRGFDWKPISDDFEPVPPFDMYFLMAVWFATYASIVAKCSDRWWTLVGFPPYSKV